MVEIAQMGKEESSPRSLVGPPGACLDPTGIIKG